LYGVSINTLLGSPRKLFCQCCGMPLEDDYISKETDGTLNEEFCKWCYNEGKFIYTNIGDLIDFLMEHSANGQCPKEEMRQFFETELRKLNHWRED
ncbi:MAG: zinc ribbon domain-containing protein, partial [Clostridia bacterium]|nr:zinc ribbon domain-containing protein [Clostridia bacterium]